MCTQHKSQKNSQKSNTLKSYNTERAVQLSQDLHVPRKECGIENPTLLGIHTDRVVIYDSARQKHKPTFCVHFEIVKFDIS